MGSINRLFLLSADFAVVVIYSLLNGPTERLLDLSTDWDRALPVVPILVIPYLLFLPFYWGLIIYSFWKNRLFLALSAAHLAIYTASFATFLTNQTFIDRPAVLGTDIFSQILRLLYQVDAPYNGFPSLHVASAIVAIFYFVAIRSGYLTAVSIFAAIVIPATVLLKQHYLVDLAGGLILGSIVGTLVFGLFLHSTKLDFSQ